MSYFTYFPNVEYYFGDEETPDVFPNIAIYATVLDEIKENVAFYQDYYIQEGERPDQVSFKLYGTPSYHWTFLLINDRLRECGWPLTNARLIEKALKDYPYTTLTTRTTLTDRFKVTQTITGTQSGATGQINHRHLDIGQIVLDNVVGTFTPGETISSTSLDGTAIETIVLHSVEKEYNSAHHYENAAGEVVDIDPTVGPGAELSEVTYLDRYIRFNDGNKQMRVIKPSAITQVVQSFREAIRS